MENPQFNLSKKETYSVYYNSNLPVEKAITETKSNNNLEFQCRISLKNFKYTIVIDDELSNISFGCQTISFETVLRTLDNFINNTETIETKKVIRKKNSKKGGVEYKEATGKYYISKSLKAYLKKDYVVAKVTKTLPKIVECSAYYGSIYFTYGGNSFSKSMDLKQKESFKKELANFYNYLKYLKKLQND